MNPEDIKCLTSKISMIQEVNLLRRKKGKVSEETLHRRICQAVQTIHEYVSKNYWLLAKCNLRL